MAGQPPQEVAITTPAATTAATANTADPMALIDHDWKRALKLSQVIRKELDFAQDKVSQDADAAMKALVHAEELLKKLRLLCVQIIILDIRAATEKSVEDTLWHFHTLVTKAYKSVIANLQGPSSVVVKRRIEKLYSTSLATSSSFYKTYMQRFCGSYKPKELERVARIVKLDELPTDMQVPAQAADPEVEQYFKHSFHKTLVYLGDLSRYRTLLRPKDRSFNAALTYYALASELMPESGYGYHQSGVIYAEAHNHLEIVYNMYRAVACDYPHPLGKTNLEREFRDLRQQKAGGARGPIEAMVSWFVKLHAFYYEGEEFTGRKEMEDEVDNHLSTALKTADRPAIDGVLLKMVLINIVAYVAAKDKVQARWTEPGSRSCEWILKLNVRTIHTLSKLLREQLEELVHQKPSAPATDSDGKDSSQTRFTPRFHRILPLFRVYMTWIYSHSEELTAFRSHLEPQFGATCRILADTLTLLLNFLSTASFDVTSVVTWLFPEDEETAGIKCLNGPELYAGCQLRYDALTRKPKPLAHEVPNANRSFDTVTFVRCTDIILCGLRLADNSPFPLEPPSGTYNTFRYIEGPKSQLASSTVVQPSSEGTAGISSTATVPATEIPATSNPSTPTHDVTVKTVISVAEEEDFSDDQEFYPSHSQKTQTANQKPPAVTNASQTASMSEFPMDTELSRILEGFLAPPEPPADRAELHPEDTSYGMGSKDAWGTATSTSPTPGSATSKTFPSLPWNWVLDVGSGDPGPRHPSTVRSAGSGWDSRPGSSNSPMLVQGADDTSDPFISHGETRSNQGHLGSSAAPPRSSASRGKIDWAVQTAQDSKHRETGLQALNIRNMWARADRESKLHNRQPSIGTAPFPWSPSIAEYQPQQYPAETSPVPQISSFPSALEFSTDSSLPQVNSPMGLPAANMQAQVPQSPQGAQNTYAFPGTNSMLAANPGYSTHALPGIFGLQGFPVEGSYGYNAGSSAMPQSHTTNQPSRYNGQVHMSAWDNAGPKSFYSDVNTAIARNENPSGLVNNYNQLPTAQGSYELAQFGWDAAQKQGPKPK